MFTAPVRITSCGHNYCEKCLCSVSKDQEEWLCPKSRNIQTVHPTMLTRNYFLEKSIIAFKESQQQITSTFQDSTSEFGECLRHKRASISKLTLTYSELKIWRYKGITASPCTRKFVR